MEAVALSMGILGFILGASALSQVQHLKKEIERLRE